MKNLFNVLKKINKVADISVYYIIMFLTYFLIPVFLLYVTYYTLFSFNIVKALVGLLIISVFVDSNKKIGG